MSHHAGTADPAALLAEVRAALDSPGDFMTLADMSTEMLESLRSGIEEWAADATR